MIEDIEQFLQAYRSAFPSRKFQKISAFQPAFERLKSGYVQIRNESRVKAINEAPGFNVFNLLGMGRDETRTHSPFLANLLNPRGSHGQGDLFLCSFLDYCLGKYTNFPQLFDDMDSSHWSTHTEFVITQGRLDIVLMNPLMGFLCLIENKIDAWEQPAQLQRYSQWMETRRKEFPIQTLLYLTIHGNEATTAWNYPYLRLSYRQDIAVWLEGCLPRIQAPSVREVVRQYISVVSRL